MSINLNPIGNPEKVGGFNNNFTLIEEELNNNVLRRDGLSPGEANQMKVDIDMNGHSLLNVNTDLEDEGSLVSLGDADFRYVGKEGSIMSGVLDMGSNSLRNLPAPVQANDATRKSYVDQGLASKVGKSGDSMSGSLDMSGNDVSNIRTTTTDNLILGGLPVSPGELNPNQVIWVDTIADLQAINTATLVDGQQVHVAGYYADASVGGGGFVWEPNRDKAEHNGGTIIDPVRVSAWDGTQSELATLFTAGSGSGCFVSLEVDVNLFHFGALENGQDIATSFQQFADSMPNRVVLNQSGEFTLSHVSFSSAATLNLYGCKLNVIESPSDAIHFAGTCLHAYVNGGELEYQGSYYYGTGTGPSWWEVEDKGVEKSGVRSEAVESIFDSVTAHGFSRYGLYIVKGDYGELRSCHCYDNGYAGGRIDALTSYVSGGEYSFNGGGNGINGYGLIANIYNGDNFEDGKVAFVGVTTTGNMTRGIDSHTGWNIRCTGCYAEGTGLAHSRWGNTEDPNGYGLRFTQRIQYLTVTGNVSKYNTSAQIALDSSPADHAVGKATLSNNSVVGDYGIRIRQYAVDELVISGNSIEAALRAIDINDFSSGEEMSFIQTMVVSGNTAKGGECHINEETSTYPNNERDWTITGNIFQDIRLYGTVAAIGGGSIIVSGNTLTGDSEGLGLFTNNFIIDRLIIEGNDLVSVQVSIPPRQFGKATNNMVRGGYIKSTLGVIAGNVFVEPETYAFYRAADSIMPTALVRFTDNTIVNNSYHQTVRFSDEFPTSCYGNTFVGTNGAKVDGVYRIDEGTLFAVGSIPGSVPDVQIDRDRGIYFIDSPDLTINSMIGTFNRGDKVINPNPTAGGYEAWLCVVGGTPGTWKGVGAIEA